MKQQGQVVIVLLLIILVSLTIALAVVQNSITDISTSTKNEQSSRAFSAAEAGLENALLTDVESILNLGNSQAEIKIDPNLPKEKGQALEYPPLTTVDFAQFWLIDPSNLADLLDGGSYNGSGDYNEKSFMVHFGNCNNPCEASTDNPAIEISIAYYDTNFTPPRISYWRNYYDSKLPSSRSAPNSFEYNSSSCDSGGLTPFTTVPSSRFYCSYKIEGADPSGVPFPLVKDNRRPILARVRILYSQFPQKLALGPDSNGKKLPAQASIYTSTGKAGDSQRQIKVFREKKVVPYFFDFALFSHQPITK